MAVYNACVTSKLLYDSDANETWTTYAGQDREKAQHIPPEKHPPYSGHIRVTNADVPYRAGLPRDQLRMIGQQINRL